MTSSADMHGLRGTRIIMMAQEVSEESPSTSAGKFQHNLRYSQSALVNLIELVANTHCLAESWKRAPSYNIG